MASPTDWTAGAAVAAAERGMGSVVIGVRDDLGATLAERAPDPARAVEAALARSRRGERVALFLAAPELPFALLALEEARRREAGAPLETRAEAGAWGGLIVHCFGGPSEVHHALSAGVIVVSTWAVQDAVDMAVVGRRAAEDSRIPVLHLCDRALGAVEPAVIPDGIGDFLGERAPIGSPSDEEVAPAPGRGSVTARAPFALGSAMRDWSERTGRSLSPILRFDTLDADEVLVVFGAATPAALAICREERARARQIGVVALRCLRPFFGPELVKATSRAKTIAVVEPTSPARSSALCPSGRLAAELKSGFADALTWAAGYPGIGKMPNVISVSLAEGASAHGLGLVLQEMERGDRARRLLSI